VCLLQAHDAAEKAEQEFTRLFTEIQKQHEQIETVVHEEVAQQALLSPVDDDDGQLSLVYTL
jgi:hypothetical protein